MHRVHASGILFALTLMSLRNTFGNNTGGPDGLYAEPQSLMHLSYNRRSGVGNERYGFMQITYGGNGPRTGETQNDGLHLGIDNQFYNGGLNGFLRWREYTVHRANRLGWCCHVTEFEEGRQSHCSTTKKT